MRWLIPQTDPAAIRNLAKALGVQMPVARVLWSRGYREASAAIRFLKPDLSQLHDPYALADMRAAVERLADAITRKERILLYGDYDVDGTSSVVMLKKGIELGGGEASFHVPHRLNEGYGMRPEVVDAAARQGVSLIVSVDTGIRAGDVVQHARELGIDVIVTDHHLPEAELPPALAILNPNRPDCCYPEKNLCGAGVVFKLLQALFGRLGWDPDRIARMTASFLKLAAIATVADVVPLTGENRIIVKRGLEGLGDVRNPGLRALIETADLGDKPALTAGEVAFRIAPRLNAAGRMASANDVIELMTTSDPARARTIAAQLHELNQERRQTEDEIRRRIIEECEATPVTDDQAALVFCGAGWHRGVVGIVASRMVERFHRPVFVLSEENGEVRGSGRSIPAFHLLEALEAMPELFTRFGGHRQAAGLTMEAPRLEEFRARFNDFAQARLTPDDFIPSLEVDAAVDFSELSEECVLEILSLAPFGFGNPEPVFVARGLEVAFDPKLVKEKHLFLKFRQNGRTVSAKAWNFGERAGEFARGTFLDAAFTVVDDPYSAERGYASWGIVLKDARPAS